MEANRVAGAAAQVPGRRAGAGDGVKLVEAAGLERVAALHRRGRRQAARRADGVRAGLAPYLRRSQPYTSDPTVGRGPGVDGMSFTVHPDGKRNTAHPAVRPSRRHWRYGRPATPSRVQNCSRHVPACRGHGAVVVSTASPLRRCAQFDGRKLWAGGRLRPLGGWRTRFAEGAAAGRPCQVRARRGGVRWILRARRHGTAGREPRRHGEHSVAVCRGTKLGASSPPTEEVQPSRPQTAAAQPERLRRRGA